MNQYQELKPGEVEEYIQSKGLAYKPKGNGELEIKNCQFCMTFY